MGELAAVAGYAVVVAFTTLPVLAVVALLLDSGRPSRGWMMTASYGAGLAAVFAVAAFGLSRIDPLSVHVTGTTELVTGVVLLLVAGTILEVRRRRRRTRASRPPQHDDQTRRSVRLSRAALLGLQFCLHPENLALTFAAAAHVRDFSAAGRIGAGIVFAAIGVSTVAIPTLAYAIAGDAMRSRLASLRNDIERHGVVLGAVLLGGVGVLLVVLGLWRVLGY